MCPDARSLASEVYALGRLCVEKCVRSERELIDEFPGQKIPEGIFYLEGRLVSIEVKRIIGNLLPQEEHETERRKKRSKKGDHISWPWDRTVEMAIEKANDEMLKKYCIRAHHVVFVYPDLLSRRQVSRLRAHVHTTVHRKKHITPAKIFTHLISGPGFLFDRLL